MAENTAKERVLQVLHDLEAEGAAKCFLVRNAGYGKRIFWRIEDGHGGVAYFEQTETALNRVTPEEFLMATAG